MEHSTKELLARLARINQHLEGTENALARIAEALEGIHGAMANGDGSYLDCLPPITDSLSNMEGLMGTRF